MTEYEYEDEAMDLMDDDQIHEFWNGYHNLIGMTGARHRHFVRVWLVDSGHLPEKHREYTTHGVVRRFLVSHPEVYAKFKVLVRLGAFK